MSRKVEVVEKRPKYLEAGVFAVLALALARSHPVLAVASALYAGTRL